MNELLTTVISIIINQFFLIAIYWIVLKWSITRKRAGLIKRFPKMSKDDIITTFEKEEWNTIQGSYYILALYAITALAIDIYGWTLPAWFENGGKYALSGVLAFCGNEALFAWLGSANKVLINKSKDIEKLGGLGNLPPNDQVNTTDQ